MVESVVAPRGRYHHGDLRAALIEAARAEVERVGAGGVSLKALAASLGVSQPAPYRHFPDREALLAAVATEGFEAFTAALRASAQGLEGQAAVEARALAYVAFGQARPGVYRLMFGAGLAPQAWADGTLGRAADAAFALLLDGVEAMGPSEPALQAAFRIWASLHGLVLLQADGFLHAPKAETLDVDALIRSVVRV